MRHLKRPALLGLLLLACLLLAGCRMDSTMEELFTLPRLPTDCLLYTSDAADE